MQKLRQGMPIVVIGTIILFVLLIIFEWGDARRGSGAVTRSSVIAGEVNGRPITDEEYQNRIDLVMQRRQQFEMMGQKVDDDRLREIAWQGLVQERLIDGAAEKLGINVTDDELANLMIYDPPAELKGWFTDTTQGGFQEAAYRQFLNDPEGFLSQVAQQRKLPTEMIDTLLMQFRWVEQGQRRQIIEGLVEDVVTSSAFPTPTEAEDLFRQANTRASGQLISIDFNRIADSAARPSEAEARAYYEAHKDEFVARPSREVKYIVFNLAPSASDSTAVFERMKRVTDALAQAKTEQESDRIFGDFVAQYRNGAYDGTRYIPMSELPAELRTALADAKQYQIIGPIQLPQGNSMIEVMDIRDGGDTTMRASHILFRTEGKNDDSVKALADKVAAQIRGGAAFEGLAQQYGSDGSAQQGGDLGYFVRGKMVPEFEAAVFGRDPGAIIGPIKTQFGWHIIKATDRVTRSYRLRDMRFDIKVSEVTKNLARQRARHLRDSLGAGASIDSLGRRMNMQVLSTGPIDPMGGQSQNARLGAFAMSAKKGEASPVLENKDGAIVGQLVDVTEAGVQPFEKVKERIMAYLTTKRKLDMIKPQATALRGRLAPGGSLTDLSAVDSTVRVVPFLNASMTGGLPGAAASDQAILSAIFSAKPGETTPAIRGEQGYYIATIDSITPPADTAWTSGKAKFIKESLDKRKQQLWSAWLQRQRDVATIEDNRYSPR